MYITDTVPKLTYNWASQGGRRRWPSSRIVFLLQRMSVVIRM
jgi:hypothetical protein